MGEPSAAEAMLAKNSSDENDGEPSERERRCLEVEEELRNQHIEAERRLNAGQMKIAEDALQAWVDELTDDYQNHVNLNQHEYGFFKGMLPDSEI